MKEVRTEQARSPALLAMSPSRPDQGLVANRSSLCEGSGHRWSSSGDVEVPVFAVASRAAAFAAIVLAGAPAAAVPVGPYASLCAAGKPAVLVRVSGFKAARGTASVKLYASDATFLERGAYIRKVEVPVNRTAPLDVCVPVPASGRYALSVRHEVAGYKSRLDGGGFSGNPVLSPVDLILKRKPDLSKVSFQIHGSTRIISVALTYMR